MNLDTVPQLLEKIHVDALSQIMDGVSFILITPEFLGEERLTSIRKALKRPLRIFGLFVVSERMLNSGVRWRDLKWPLFGIVFILFIFSGIPSHFHPAGIFSKFFFICEYIARVGILHWLCFNFSG
jgi:hypothetical protein